jgi:hypothetical protein
MATIVILEHLLQARLGLPYMVNALAQRWAREARPGCGT